MMQKRFRSDAFTLIEVLVAMLILAIGLLGLAGITVVVLRSNLLSQQMSEASNIASSLIEDIRRQRNLSNCEVGNTLMTIPDPCDILRQSGVASAGNTLLPTKQNDACAMNILGGSTPATFDAISANLQTRVDYSASTDVCDIETPPSGAPYIRYYRVYQPEDGTSTEHQIVAVVLWKDKYGKWRKVSFDTRRSD